MSHQSQFNENKMPPLIENQTLTSKRADHFLRREDKKSFLLPAMKTPQARPDKLLLYYTKLSSSPIHTADFSNGKWKYSILNSVLYEMSAPPVPNFIASEEGNC